MISLDYHLYYQGASVAKWSNLAKQNSKGSRGAGLEIRFPQGIGGSKMLVGCAALKFPPLAPFTAKHR